MMDSLDFEALHDIGLTLPMLQQLPGQAPTPEARLFRVVELQRDHLLLHDGHQARRARAAPALSESLQADDDALAVGDWVVARPEGGDGLVITDRLTPLTRIARRTHDGRGGPKRQVLVTNVDTALMVMGLDHDFNVRRLERYLALARLAGVQAVLVLTKADSLPLQVLAQRIAQARACLPAGVPCLALDGRSADVVPALAPWVQRGRTLVLLGSSGAGKSTLTNQLTGQQDQATGAVRADDSRGRHTTTVRTLHRTPGGACIIDTPGLRALRLDVGDEAQLGEVFGDVARWSTQCRFRNCRHEAEPGCAVREAVAPERLRNFHKLEREAKRDRMSVLERREQLAMWKARGRQAEIRMRAKRSG